MNSGVLKGYAVPCSLIKCAATSASTAILCNISQHLYVLQLVQRFKLVVMYYIGSQHFSRWQYNTVVPHILADDNIAQWVPTFQPTEIQHSVSTSTSATRTRLQIDVKSCAMKDRTVHVSLIECVRISAPTAPIVVSQLLHRR